MGAICSPATDIEKPFSRKELVMGSTTVEMDSTGYDDLKSQIQQGKVPENKDQDIRGPIKVEKETKETPPPTNKKYVFKRGDDSVELDDDFELEMTADKKPVRMSLRELRERAAGDVAVKNRMHALAEEKKRVQATFKQFADLSKTDPLAALEFISNKANEADGEFEYNKYIEKLAEQAENLGKMNQEQRKAHDLEKKLSKAEQDLSRKERESAVVLRKQEILANYPQIGNSEFGQMVDAVLNSPEILENAENEDDVMDKVEYLIQETLTQRDIMSVIQEVNPAHLNDNSLIFALSDQLRQNPDLDEEDVRDILRDLIGKQQKETVRNDRRDQEIRTLSHKQRQSMSDQQLRDKDASSYDLLMNQLLENKEQFKKTPIAMR